jgi:hypothetical protein
MADSFEGCGIISGGSHQTAVCRTCRCAFDSREKEDGGSPHHECGHKGEWLKSTAVVPKELTSFLADEEKMNALYKSLLAREASTEEYSAYFRTVDRLRQRMRAAFREVLRVTIDDGCTHRAELEHLYDANSWVFDKLDASFYSCPACGLDRMIRWQTGYWD